ncbi:MAG: hypothetical protein AMXMBFR83_22290 [Phycisphaerae bacterium]
MQWFNWVLRGGRMETLPDYYLDQPRLRAMYPDPDQARRALTKLLADGPLGESELRRLTARQLDAYVRQLIRRHHETHGRRWHEPTGVPLSSGR